MVDANANDPLQIDQFVKSLTARKLVEIGLLGSFRRGGAISALIGMTAGLAVVLVVRFATPVALPWYTVIGSLTTVAVGMLVALIGRH